MKNLASKEFRIISLWFKLLGCLDSPVQNIIYITLLSIILFAVFFGEFIGFLNHNSVQERAEIIFNVAVLVYFIFTYLAVRRNYSEMVEFLTTISTPTGINSDLQSTVFQLTLQKASVVVPRVLVIFASLIVFGVFQWCYSPLLKEFNYRSKNFHIGPFFYQCAVDGGNRFPLKSICIQMNSFAQYIIANSFLTMITLWGFIAYTWTFAFSIFICIFVETNITVLTDRLLQLRKRTEYFDRVSTDRDNRLTEQFEAALRNEFIKIIQYYQYLHRIFPLVIPLIEMLCNIMFLSYWISQSLAAFLMMNETKSAGYFMFQLKIGGGISNAALVFLVFSYCAHVVSEMNEKIHLALYSMTWYDETANFQKLVLQFQQQLYEPLKVQTCGCLATNLNLFATVINLTYKVLNLMLAKFGK